MNGMVKPTEVSSKAHRRRFTAAEKIRILREADACAHETGGGDRAAATRGAVLLAPHKLAPTARSGPVREDAEEARAGGGAAGSP